MPQNEVFTLPKIRFSGFECVSLRMYLCIHRALGFRVQECSSVALGCLL